MKRDVSTSTIGREEARKPLMAAYVIQRRILLGCSVLMVLSLIIWITAISTDHWTIISGGGGIFIPETRRFFISSHSGLLRFCRYTVSPNPLPNAHVIRNFTTLAPVSPTTLNDAKRTAARSDFIKTFSNEMVEVQDGSMSNFTESAKRRMFAHWVRNEIDAFKHFKKIFKEIALKPRQLNDIEPAIAKPISVDPLDVEGVQNRNIFGKALQKVQLNSGSLYLVIPEAAQLAIFEGWNEKEIVPKLFYPFARDLDIPPFVLNEERRILQLVPPSPPKSGHVGNGYDYLPNQRCKYIDMFANAKSIRTEPGFDATLLDYIRTQSSFACITVFVMGLGTVFSFYTFMNPRYMFKRLAGGIHLVSASTAFVVLQVLFSSVDYTKQHLFYAYPEGAKLKYGYGVFLAWFSFVVNVVCGLLFMWYSGKKKGSKAPNDELAMADEPTIMGR